MMIIKRFQFDVVSWMGLVMIAGFMFVVPGVHGADIPFETMIDSRVASVEAQVNRLRRAENRSVFSNISRLENNVNTLRDRFKNLRTQNRSQQFDQFLDQLRTTRESLASFLEEVREEWDDGLVDLVDDGVDWEEYYDHRSRDSASQLPGTSKRRSLFRELEQVDDGLRRIQDLVSLWIQVRVTRRQSTVRDEYLGELLDTSFRHYLEDRLHRESRLEPSSAIYRTVIRSLHRDLRDRSDSGAIRGNRQALGRELRFQGRVLLEWPTDHTEHRRVLELLNETVVDLLPGAGSGDRFEGLRQ